MEELATVGIVASAAAVVWLAHEGSLIRVAPEHLVDCSRYLVPRGFEVYQI